ncbi:unnamed protein product [Cladocopium goreaui]|uniref:Uncharacterized protein n=1 Tax=Cladocopium goreaui TaxID=2562237 RepID=A0A9P1C8P9_9DINO|nr:unnamed protein product [Cladocopium goreaui]
MVTSFFARTCRHPAYYLSGSWNNWGPGGIAMIEEAPESQGMWNGIYEAGFAHCQSLARASGGSESTREANWKWAGDRACKLADTMKAEDLARCAGAFASAEQRDFRVLFLLAEEAIAKAPSFEVAEAVQMLEAYAALNVRNEHLFEALTKRLLTEEQPMAGEVLQRVLLAHRSLKLMELSTCRDGKTFSEVCSFGRFAKST